MESMSVSEDVQDAELGSSSCSGRDSDVNIRVDDTQPSFILADMKGHSTHDWVSMAVVRGEIANRIRRFLNTFNRADGSNYKQLIVNVCGNNHSSIVISYDDITVADPTLALFLIDAPALMLIIFSETIFEYVLHKFPHYTRISDHMAVRIADYGGIEAISQLRNQHLDKLIRVSGIVTTSTQRLLKYKSIVFKCFRCEVNSFPIVQPDYIDAPPPRCASCQDHQYQRINEYESKTIDYQRITLQEVCLGSEIPRRKDCILVGDLCDSFRVGDEVDITGILTIDTSLSARGDTGRHIFSTHILVNYLKCIDAEYSASISDSDILNIKRLANKPDISDLIAASLAPSIHGRNDVKLAVALSLFGGQCKFSRAMRIRGDINVLIVGDPGKFVFGS